MFEKIKALCKINHISVRQLEIALGMSNGTLSKWNEANPGIFAVKSVADYFGITINALLGNEETEDVIPTQLKSLILQLNEQGIEMLTIMARGLVITDEYKKSNKSNNVQKDA